MSDHREARRRTVPFKLIAALVVIALLVIFWSQNRTKVKVTFWVVDATVRIWVALLIASVAGFVAGFLVRGERH